MSDRTKRVLIVDDNVDSAELTAEMLRSHGLEVAIANGSLAALELAATFLPEVALLDIGLPGMDGYELARRLARAGIGCRLIAITGHGTARDHARSQAEGFTAHLTKPVTTAAILAAIADGDPTIALAATQPRAKTGDELENATDGDDVASGMDAVVSVSDRG